MGRNPLMDILSPQQPLQGRNPMAMLSEFRRFAQGMTPAGAKQQVEDLLASGKMSRQQFEQLQKEAQSFAKLLGMR